MIYSIFECYIPWRTSRALLEDGTYDYVYMAGRCFYDLSRHRGLGSFLDNMKAPDFYHFHVS